MNEEEQRRKFAALQGSRSPNDIYDMTEAKKMQRKHNIERYAWELVLKGIDEKVALERATRFYDLCQQI